MQRTWLMKGNGFLRPFPSLKTKCIAPEMIDLLGCFGFEVGDNITRIEDDDLDTEFANSPDHFTPWLKLEWAELKATYLTQILSAGA